MNFLDNFNFEYWDDNDPIKKKFGFRFCTYDIAYFDWEKDKRVLQAKTCVLLLLGGAHYYYLPIINRQIIWDIIPYEVQQKLPQELIKIINKFAKNLAFM
jgi:hypothetical protein